MVKYTIKLLFSKKQMKNYSKKLPIHAIASSLLPGLKYSDIVLHCQGNLNT